MASVTVRNPPDLTRWREHCAQVRRDPIWALYGATRDHSLLYSLIGWVDRGRHTLLLVTEQSNLRLTLVVPAEGWAYPTGVDGAVFDGMPVRLSDQVAWPSLMWELSGGG